jgi:hypothetical protein
VQGVEGVLNQFAQGEVGFAVQGFAHEQLHHRVAVEPEVQIEEMVVTCAQAYFGLRRKGNPQGEILALRQMGRGSRDGLADASNLCIDPVENLVNGLFGERIRALRAIVDQGFAVGAWLESRRVRESQVLLPFHLAPGVGDADGLEEDLGGAAGIAIHHVGEAQQPGQPDPVHLVASPGEGLRRVFANVRVWAVVSGESLEEPIDRLTVAHGEVGESCSIIVSPVSKKAVALARGQKTEPSQDTVVSGG